MEKITFFSVIFVSQKEIIPHKLKRPLFQKHQGNFTGITVEDPNNQVNSVIFNVNINIYQ